MNVDLAELVGALKQRESVTRRAQTRVVVHADMIRVWARARVGTRAREHGGVEFDPGV